MLRSTCARRPARRIVAAPSRPRCHTRVRAVGETCRRCPSTAATPSAAATSSRTSRACRRASRPTTTGRPAARRASSPTSSSIPAHALVVPADVPERLGALRIVRRHHEAVRRARVLSHGSRQSARRLHAADGQRDAAHAARRRGADLSRRTASAIRSCCTRTASAGSPISGDYIESVEAGRELRLRDGGGVPRRPALCRHRPRGASRTWSTRCSTIRDFVAMQAVRPLSLSLGARSRAAPPRLPRPHRSRQHRRLRREPRRRVAAADGGREAHDVARPVVDARSCHATRVSRPPQATSRTSASTSIPRSAATSRASTASTLPYLAISGTADTTAPISEAEEGMRRLAGTRQLVAFTGLTPRLRHALRERPQYVAVHVPRRAARRPIRSCAPRARA